MKAKELGIAVVGSGRIGTLRARLAVKHPAIRFLAVSDKKVENAKALADLTDADFYSTDNNEVIARPEVNAVFVSTFSLNGPGERACHAGAGDAQPESDLRHRARGRDRASGAARLASRCGRLLSSATFANNSLFL